MTVKDAAVRLEVSRTTVYQLVADRKIRHRRIGSGHGGIRISEAAIEEFLKGCEVEPVGMPAREPEAPKYVHLRLGPNPKPYGTR